MNGTLLGLRCGGLFFGGHRVPTNSVCNVQLRDAGVSLWLCSSSGKYVDIPGDRLMTSHTLAPAACCCAPVQKAITPTTRPRMKLSTSVGNPLYLAPGGPFAEGSGQRFPAVSHGICRRGIREHLKSSWRPKPEQADLLSDSGSRFTHFGMLGDVPA